ncbi:putative helicase [Campylobacter iguaniorum]|uniref:DUF4041 domain-containing protein n=1 Tax=Campylobacter iguaniorum TaxID=1244531 RepID=UPI00073A4C78|nr:DUF4041 domain-containing protein [Campylobacter iguaniorum]ALV25064.1 putative helicase [Campylobacter iguaniorum]
MEIIIALAIFTGLPCLITYFFAKKLFAKKIGIATLSTANKATIEKQNLMIKTQIDTLQKNQEDIENQKSEIKSNSEINEKIKTENTEIISLLNKEKELSHSIEILQNDLKKYNEEKDKLNEHISELVSTDDLYSRIDELVSYGHYEMPEYLYDTSDRFSIEIKNIRQKQKEMIVDKIALTYPEDNLITNFTKLEKQIFSNTIKLMLRTYNIECDMLIAKTTPSNFTRTLEQISKLASDVENLSLTLEIGFDDKYVKLKMQECELMYQYKLKKQEEQEEQKLLKEQMREEQKANLEYQKAIDNAKKEEDIYQKLLERAKRELEFSNDKEVAKARIEELERQLAQAKEASQRAISMAEQTRKGYVYIISNIGSFGDDVYKIGMTRRLEPMDRVRELGDASVPFGFDVHAIIACDDAPSVENQLHKYFAKNRVNAVNFRKEFFKISLDEIKTALNEIIKDDYDFKTTIVAEEYYETKRLQAHLG